MNRPVLSAIAFLSPLFMCSIFVGNVDLIGGCILLAVGFGLALFVDNYA